MPSSDDVAIQDNAERSRLEIIVDDHTAFLGYRRTPEVFEIIHTEVPGELGGRHLGDALVKAAVRTARTEGLRLVVICPFARAYLRRHPEVLSSQDSPEPAA